MACFVPTLSPHANEKISTIFSVLQATESWAGPGNETSACMAINSSVLFPLLHFPPDDNHNIQLKHQQNYFSNSSRVTDNLLKQKCMNTLHKNWPTRDLRIAFHHLNHYLFSIKPHMDLECEGTSINVCICACVFMCVCFEKQKTKTKSVWYPCNLFPRVCLYPPVSERT